MTPQQLQQLGGLVPPPPLTTQQQAQIQQAWQHQYGWTPLLFTAWVLSLAIQLGSIPFGGYLGDYRVPLGVVVGVTGILMPSIAWWRGSRIRRRQRVADAMARLGNSEFCVLCQAGVEHTHTWPQ